MKIRTLICLAPLLASGQLELPSEYANPEQTDPGIYVPAPEQSGGLHNTNQVGTSTTGVTIGTLSVEDDTTLNRLRSGQSSFRNHNNNQPRPGQGPSAIKGGPTNLTASVRIRDGRTLQGQIRNQPVLVDSAVGRLLVPLHSVERIDLSQGIQDVQVFCHSGDLMTGSLVNISFELIHPTGARERISAKRCVSVLPEP